MIRFAAILPLVLVVSACAGAAAETRPDAPPEPDVTLVYAGAAQGSGLVAEPLEVPFGRDTDGIAARQVFLRAAAARGAKYVSDLEYHLAVKDGESFECVVLLQTVPADAPPAAAAPDEITTRLTREVQHEVDAEYEGKRCTSTMDGRTCAAVIGVKSLVLPYWADNAGFLPVYYRTAPESDKWKLFVSEPHCTAASTPLASHFLRWTIYLPPRK
jgi:hypothetical protein